MGGLKKALIYFLFLYCCQAAVLPSIPSHLLDCYRRGGPHLNAPRRLDVLLSLLKKLELNTQLDMRLLSSSLLRHLRLDGIEQAPNVVESDIILPYRASSFQYYRYKLLMDLFLPSQNLLNADEILDLTDKCLLHKLLSSSVRRWERGDESIVCPLSAEFRQNLVTNSQDRLQSRCPLEEGVIQTEWGTISPGTLISSIASSLENQRVLITDILSSAVYREDVAEPLMTSAQQEWIDNIETLGGDHESQVEGVDISNVWVASLAGDLAEVVVNQGPRVGPSASRMVIGSNNNWNDTILPRVYYLYSRNETIDWHFTDAEILAGVDGLILSSYVPTWVTQRRSLRLSQVIQMYYSNEGISFDPEIKACNRLTQFMKVFDSSQLLTETVRFAHVLSLKQITVYIPVEDMQRMAEAAVSAFTTYIQSILKRNHRSCVVSHSVPVMDLVVATDASWKSYQVEQFMSWIGGALDLHWDRSTISLLHGNNGQWIVPPVDNMTSFYSLLANYTEEFPTRLNLPNVISSVIQHSLNKTLLDGAVNASAGPSTVVLIISPNDRPSNPELERSTQLMNSLRNTYFDVYFAYAAMDLSDFQNVNNEYLDYSELFLKVYSVLNGAIYNVNLVDGASFFVFLPNKKQQKVIDGEQHLTNTPRFQKLSSSTVSDVITTVDTYLIKNTIPTRIFGPHCPFNGTVFTQRDYEDFVVPGREKTYRIHPFYLRQQPLINVQFRNDGQGRILVCMWGGARDSSPQRCQTIIERDVFIFNSTNPCPSLDFCPPLRFVVTAVTSQNICANNDCRVPNQVGFYLQQSGLRCLPLRNRGVSLVISPLVISILISILALH